MKSVKDKRAVSDVVGAILMVAIVVAVATAVYVTISGLTSHSTPVPHFPSFSQDRSAGKLTVVSIGSSLTKWSDLQIDPNTVLIHDDNNNGYLDAGEYIYNCTGKEVTITYTPSNTLLGTWDFT